jgi:sugar lactone lactonase YvrE
MKIMLTKLVSTAIILLALPVLSTSAGEKPFPKQVPALDGAQPEGFTIGRGATAYNGSPDGSIYKVDLRSGQGEILVDAVDPFDCLRLGMRVDRRTNYLFVAGCVYGNAYVYDADNGDELMEYQLGPDGEFALPNDLAITKDAVYFTDSYLPLIYRLPLARNGGLPPNADDVTEILLPDEFILDPENDDCCGANGIVATPNGKTLIIGHSNLAALYRIDPATGIVDEIEVNPPLSGFLDGIVLHGQTLYILTPSFDPEATPEMVQVVKLDKDMRTGELLGFITDPELDGIASGALFGKSLYVNNARYSIDFPPAPGAKFFITKLNRHAVE